MESHFAVTITIYLGLATPSEAAAAGVVMSVCCQCAERERECQKACPLDPPAISYDKEKFHMVVDKERCLGSSCAQCQDACPACVSRFYPPGDYCLLCDLCETDGQRKPACVEVCPNYALEYMAPQFPQHLERVHPDQKAEYLSKRLYPLPKDRISRPFRRALDDLLCVLFPKFFEIALFHGLSLHLLLQGEVVRDGDVHEPEISIALGHARLPDLVGEEGDHLVFVLPVNTGEGTVGGSRFSMRSGKGLPAPIELFQRGQGAQKRQVSLRHVGVSFPSRYWIRLSHVSIVYT